MKKVFIFLCVFLIIVGISFVLAATNLQKTVGIPTSNIGFIQKVTLGTRLFFSLPELTQPVDNNKSPLLFVVNYGDTVQNIALRLRETGVVRDDGLFTDYLIFSGKDRTLRSGNYWVDAGLNMIQVADIFQDLDPDNIIFGFLPGWRVEEIAALLPSSGLSIDPNEMLSIVRANSVDGLPMELDALSTLEGFLFPGKYKIPRAADAAGMVSILAEKFWEEAGSTYVETIKKQGLSLQEAVILASIIEREAVDKSESALIASVFYNRFRSGMPLQSDPTVQYALGFDEIKKIWWRVPLTQQDLTIPSLFNTYNQTGLPPYPICNPGVDALMAVAFPAVSDFYYFRAACDNSGKHVFSRSYAEHLENTCP